MVVLVALAITILYPPQEKLKGGIDLVGGTSLLYEIDTTGLEPAQQRNLSTRVISILRERVDPEGQKNLEWRPVGNTRLEVRMPRPPKVALERRDAFNRARKRLEAKNITRFEVETALNATGEQRAALLEGLKRGVSARGPLIEKLTAAYDAYREAMKEGDEAKIKERSEAYEAAMTELLDTCFPVQRLMDILESMQGEKREAELAKLRKEHPDYDAGTEQDPDGKLLTKVVAAYDRWSRHKGQLEDPEDLKRLLRGAGVLEFRILADRNPASPDRIYYPADPNLEQPIRKYVDQLKRYGPRPQPGDRYVWLPVEDVVSFLHLKNLEEFEARKNSPSLPIVEEYTGRYYVLAHDDPEFCMLKGTGRQSWKLVEAYPDRDPMTGRNVVAFRLDPRGGQLFGELTENNKQRNLCIVLDGSAMSYAVIQSRITTRGQITGNFTKERVQNLVRILEAGSLPARLKEPPLMENTIGPSLGETNRTKGMRAAAWGLIAVVVFMAFYYGIIAGGMADVALALNMLFVLAIMALLQATFTLPGIAGLILTIGMAVDANVLIFERIREERDRGVVFRRALNNGYDKAFSTIFDANLTTLITCVILGFVGSEEVKGFAVTLGIGIVTSMFTALFVTRLVFNTLIAKGWLKDFSMRRIIGVPKVDWLAIRKTFWPVSTTAVAVGLVLFVGMSTAQTELMYDIEFLGGTSIQVDLKPGVSMSDEEMRHAVTGKGQGGDSAADWLVRAADMLDEASVSLGTNPGEFVVDSKTLTSDQLAAMILAVGGDRLVRIPTHVSAHQAVFTAKDEQLDLGGFQTLVKDAVVYAREASRRLRTARVQSVGLESGGKETKERPLSYEVVTTETSRELVQAAVLATLGDKLSVQRALAFTTVKDEEITHEPYFVVEMDDRYLSDVVGGDAPFDIRRFRGGVAVEVELDPQEEPISVEEFERRLRQVGLLPEFERLSMRESAVFPLGTPEMRPDGQRAYRKFVALTNDESLPYDEDPDQWAESLARPYLAQVEAA
ncbi:MAG: protein translocase subunit SecD, partial [Planctomycetota bacterium]